MIEEKINYRRKSYTIADFYLDYKSKIEEGTVYDVNLKTYKAILVEYLQFLRDQIMLESKEVKLPCRLGTLQIVKHKPKEYTGKSLRWDWKATKEAGKPVYLLNLHSNEYKFRFFWSKQNCLTANKSKYQFVATRDNKRNLAKIIFAGNIDFIEK